MWMTPGQAASFKVNGSSTAFPVWAWLTFALALRLQSEFRTACAAAQRSSHSLLLTLQALPCAYTILYFSKFVEPGFAKQAKSLRISKNHKFGSIRLFCRTFTISSPGRARLCLTPAQFHSSHRDALEQPPNLNSQSHSSKNESME